MKTLTKIVDWVERIALILAGIAILVMAAVLMYQVFMRYVMHNATSWSDEVATLMFVWMAMLAIPIGIRRHEHISVEYFVGKLPEFLQKYWFVLINVLVAGTMAVIGWFSLGLLPSAKRQLLSGLSLSTGIDISMWWMYLAAPVGCALTILFCIERIVNDLTNTDQWEVRNPSELDEILDMEPHDDMDVNTPTPYMKEV